MSLGTDRGVSGTALPAGLLVIPSTAPSITTPPANQTAYVGQTATFTVVAAGTAPLTYQWQMNGMNVGTNSPSFTTATLALVQNNAKITVKVTNSAGSVTSNQATLTVKAVPPPTITVQPQNRTVDVGFTATFAVTATSPAPITYQWFKNGFAVAGATAATYTTPATTMANSGDVYTVTVTNSAGPTTSHPATLTVEVPTTNVPLPWLDSDVGATAMAGSAILGGTATTVCGSGADIGGTADAFNFLYQPLTGDGSLAAFVSPGSTKALAKVGVMIRSTLAAGSPMAGMFVTGSDGTVFIDRTAASGTAADTAGTPAAVPVPYWVKVDRAGNTLTGSISPDGVNWTVVGTATIAMPSSAFIGFAVTAGDKGDLHCATINAWSGSGGWNALVGQPRAAGGKGGVCGLLGLEAALLLLALRTAGSVMRAKEPGR
jgi:hypothetical protein